MTSYSPACASTCSSVGGRAFSSFRVGMITETMVDHHLEDGGLPIALGVSSGYSSVRGGAAPKLAPLALVSWGGLPKNIMPHDSIHLLRSPAAMKHDRNRLTSTL